MQQSVQFARHFNFQRQTLSLMAVGYLLAVLFVFTYKLSVFSTNAIYQDPKKIFFTFDDDEEEDNITVPNVDDNTDETSISKPDCTVHTEKFKTCLRDKKKLYEKFFVFLRFIRKNADESATQQTMTFDLTFTRSDLRGIEKALETGICPDEVPFLLTHFHLHESWKSEFLQDVKNQIVQHKTLIIFSAIGCLGFLLLTYWVWASRSWVSGVLKMLALFFSISVVFTWLRKYQEELAKNKLILKDGIPLSCRSGDQSFYDRVWMFINYHFSVMPDECLKYHEAEMVDPILKNTILEALSETTSRFILTPLPIVFEYAGQAVVKLFQVVPTHLWLPVGITITVVLFVYLLISHGYRFRSLLFSIEPGIPPPSHICPAAANQYQLAPKPENNALQGTIRRNMPLISQGIIREHIEELSSASSSQPVQNPSDNLHCEMLELGSGDSAEHTGAESGNTTKEHVEDLPSTPTSALQMSKNSCDNSPES